MQGNCAKRTQFPAAPAGTGPPGRRTWANCVKRTKSWRSFKCQVSSLKPEGPAASSRHSHIPHYSNIPLFHYSSPMPFVQNEPNSRHGRAGRGRRDVGRGANVQNEPNFRRGRAGRGHRAQDAGQLCKTNPISGAAERDGAKGRRTRANCAKRTQFPVGPSGTGPQGRGTWSKTCKTNPIWPGRGRARPPVGERCKTNQICRPPHRGQEQVGRGRPTHEEPTCAERTQSGTSFKFEVSRVKLEPPYAGRTPLFRKGFILASGPRLGHNTPERSQGSAARAPR